MKFSVSLQGNIRFTSNMLRFLVVLVSFFSTSLLLHASHQKNRSGHLNNISRSDIKSHLLGEFMGTNWNEDMPIRIGVMEKQKTIKISGEAPLLCSSNGQELVLEGGKSYILRIKSSKAAKLNYYPVVKTVVEEQSSLAEQKNGVMATLLNK